MKLSMSMLHQHWCHSPASSQCCSPPTLRHLPKSAAACNFATNGKLTHSPLILRFNCTEMFSLKRQSSFANLQNAGQCTTKHPFTLPLQAKELPDVVSDRVQMHGRTHLPERRPLRQRFHSRMPPPSIAATDLHILLHLQLEELPRPNLIHVPQHICCICLRQFSWLTTSLLFTLLISLTLLTVLFIAFVDCLKIHQCHQKTVNQSSPYWSYHLARVTSTQADSNCRNII